MLQSRSGRVFSPYEPWALAPVASTMCGAPSNVRDGVDFGQGSELTVLVAHLNFEDALKPAVQEELRRAEDAAGDCEGADISPPPSPLLSPNPSPLTSLPSSAENSPTIGPSPDPNESIPSLALAPPSSSAQNLSIPWQSSAPGQPAAPGTHASILFTPCPTAATHTSSVSWAIAQHVNSASKGW